MTDLDQRTIRLRDLWAQLSSSQRSGAIATAVVAIVIVGGAGVLIGRQTSDGQAVQPTTTAASDAGPCDLFPPAIARELVGEAVERFDLERLVPSDASAERRGLAATAAAKTCAYVPEGEDIGEENSVALQLDRNLFSSEEEFVGANEQNGSERVPDIGDAAVISQGNNGGWQLAVLLTDGYSFTFVVADELASRDEVIAAGRRIADDFDT